MRYTVALRVSKDPDAHTREERMQAFFRLRTTWENHKSSSNLVKHTLSLEAKKGAMALWGYASAQLVKG